MASTTTSATCSRMEAWLDVTAIVLAFIRLGMATFRWDRFGYVSPAAYEGAAAPRRDLMIRANTKPGLLMR